MAEWNRIRAVFETALSQSEPGRTAYLDDECGADIDLRREVESLLTSHDEAGSLLETPAFVDPSLPQSGLCAGDSLSHYKIVEKIGEGGMGEVFLGIDTSLNRKVALKLLPPCFSEDEGRLRRFEQEAFAASSLNHPNIVTIHEFSRTEEGKAFIAAEFVEGESLTERIASGEMTLEEELEIAGQIASALSAAHEAGVIHRDIKPDNIIVRPDGLVKVLDFGIAKFLTNALAQDVEAETRPMVRTQTGMVIGSAPYMSPEQAQGKEVDLRTDIWSLGVVLYEMLAERVPFRGKSVSHTIVEIVEKEPKLIDGIPNMLQILVSKSLSKDREMRYQSAKDFVIDLRNLSRELDIQCELERSVIPEQITYDSENETVVHSTAEAEETRNGEPQNTKAVTRELSLGYAGKQAKSHKAVTFSIIGVVVAGLAVLGYIYLYLPTTAPLLTDKDVILITDFDNKTGEEDFDGALRLGLKIALEQSPLLSIFQDSKARETLKHMRQDPDAKITKELGREICQRNGLKALIAGSIVRFDRAYNLTLEAVNAETGEVFARTQTSAAGKDQILDAVSKGATEIREKLGESLAQIEKFDKPLPKVTTSSLEALRLFSLAVEMRAGGSLAEVIRLLERAVEIDPEFARGHLTLFNNYRASSQTEQAFESLKKAYALREKVSERERVVIDGIYYAELLGDSHKGIEVLQAGAEMFPRSLELTQLLAHEYSKIGELEKALSQAEMMGELTRGKRGYWNRAKILILLGRYEDAKDDLERARQKGKGIDFVDLGVHRFNIALIEGDSKEMERELRLFEDGSLGWFAEELRAGIAAYRGQFRKSEEHTRKAVALRIQSGVGGAEAVAWGFQWNIFVQALAGECSEVKSLTREFPNGPSHFELIMYRPASLALCKEDAQARTLVDRAKAKYPDSTRVNKFWVPVIDAVFALEKGEPKTALEKLEGLRTYERSVYPQLLFLPQSLRARAFHLLGNHKAEKAEYEAILANPALGWYSPLYPLAQLGKARITKSKKEYEKFFEMWKDADEDLPDLIAAKKEYAALS